MRNLFQLDYELAKHPFAAAIILCLSAALCGYWLLYPAQIALLMPDSTSYIEFQDYRGAGYPAFLAFIKLFGLNLEQTVISQTILFFISLSFLCNAFNQRFKSLVLSIALLIGIGLNPAIARYNFSIITESVYFSSLFLFLGLTLTCCFQRTSRGRIMGRSKYILIGSLFAWLILIKPVSWSLISVPILLIWQHLSLRENTFKVTALILLGFMTMHIAGTAYRYSVHQQLSGSSFFGNQLIGKLAFTDFKPETTPYPEAGKIWLDIMKPSHDARKKLDNHSERFLFSLNTYDFLRFDNMPAIVEAMKTDDKNSAQKDLALAVLKQNPQNYAYDVALNFFNLWSIGELQRKSFSQQYNQKLDQITDEFKGKIPKPYYLNEEGSLQVILIKPLLTVIALLNIFTVLIGVLNALRLKAQSPEFTHLFIMACTVNAYFLLTALLQAALTRYAIVAWPMHLMLLLGICALLRKKILNNAY